MPNRGDFAAAIAKMEAHLAAHPEDGKAQELMAPVWQRMGRFQEAIAAREAALKALGDTPERRIRLAEAFAAAENGEITPQAQEQIERALELDPKWPEARYFLGLAAAQKGDVEKARALWRALAADLPEGESARAAVEEKIAELDGPQGPSSPQSPSAPQDQASPQGQAAQAVAQMPPDQQQQTIRAMVERLNDRLAEKGGTVEEWSRLIRAYKVLNEEAKARQTLANARKAYAADAPALETIDGQARDLGLDGK
jgi:cytochrome c-type biogenesis protein CcmH